MLPREAMNTLAFGSRVNSVTLQNPSAKKAIGNSVEQNRLQACLAEEQDKVLSVNDTKSPEKTM